MIFQSDGLSIIKQIIARSSSPYGRMLVRKLPLHLLFTNDKLNWCQENESYLREKCFSRTLTSQELIDLYRKGDPNLDMPPRVGRYLGFKALQKYVGHRTKGGINELLSDRKKTLALEL